MDRRLFLQSVSALASCSVLPAQAATLSDKAAVTDECLEFTLPHIDDAAPRIGVVAVGGAGNALLARYRDQLPGLTHAIALNTDAFGLMRSRADVNIQVGEGFAKAHDPHAVRFLSQRVRPQLLEALSGLDLVFIVGALGGAAGSGIAPMVAEASRSQGLFTVSGAILPFALEGARRRQIAEAAFKALTRRTDVCVALDNQCFADRPGEEILSATLAHAPEAFLSLYQCFRNTLGADSNSAITPSEIRRLFSGSTGKTVMGFSSTDGAALGSLLPQALAHPLILENSLVNAETVLFSIEAPPGALKMKQAADWASMLEMKASKARIVWNFTVNPESHSKTELTVLVRAHG